MIVRCVDSYRSDNRYRVQVFWACTSLKTTAQTSSSELSRRRHKRMTTLNEVVDVSNGCLRSFARERHSLCKSGTLLHSVAVLCRLLILNVVCPWPCIQAAISRWSLVPRARRSYAQKDMLAIVMRSCYTSFTTYYDVFEGLRQEACQGKSPGLQEKRFMLKRRGQTLLQIH